MHKVQRLITLTKLRNRLEKYELEVTLLADGNVGLLEDGPMEYWFDPYELQEYLDKTPEAEWNARSMPLNDFEPPYSVIERLSDNGQTPGTYYYCPLDLNKNARLKRFSDNSYLLSEPGEQPMFLTPAQADVYGLHPKNLKPI